MTTINPIINTFTNIFRSTYGSSIDIVNTPMARYHDALHALTGIGISAMEEADILVVEAFLREDPVSESNLDMVREYIDMIPEEIFEILKEFYIAN